MMDRKKEIIYPYIPNSVPETKDAMLQKIGVEDVDQLYGIIPEKLRLKQLLNLPEPLLSETELKRHVRELLTKNQSCENYLNFMGGGCWQHFVPAVCDEINGRSEFLTAYGGTSYNNLGRFQAHFEFQSQMGELLDMDVVAVPTYSWGTAAGYAIRMAARLTGRNEILISRSASQERRTIIQNFAGSSQLSGYLECKTVEYDKMTGMLDLQTLKEKISDRTAAVYIENPTYLGGIESQGETISELAHAHGAISIVGVDPISLGVLAPPAHYGADIVVGTVQTLGIHMNGGGGCVGFIASRDEEAYVSEFPLFLISITDTVKKGEYGFGQCTFDRTSYMGRERAKDWVGTVSGLWTITAAVYLALMGPNGFLDIGRTIIQKAHYALKLLSELEGVEILFGTHSFKEFVVNFDKTGQTVKQINKMLLDYRIFGGKDISSEFPELGQSALYCVTEIHHKDDIERLVSSLKEILQ
jgi:glycine dehydrogenase subunit 1